MTAYWILFFLSFAIGLSGRFFDRHVRIVIWTALGGLAALIIGLRHEVGADWYNYLAQYDEILASDFLEALTVTDPGYAAVNWISGKLDVGIYGANFVGAIILVVGLGLFCRQQPIPWLAWLIAVPYLLVVVGMGYTRQAAALGFAFWALTLLERKYSWRFVLIVCLGATFHRSVVLLLPLVFFLQERATWTKVVGLFMVMATAVVVFLLEALEALVSVYLTDQEIASEGGPVRVLMNAVPALLLLIHRGKWARRWPDPGYWKWVALMAIACIFLVGLASTAVDRIALYLAPIQLYVWSRYPLLFQDAYLRAGSALAICFVYAMTLFVWLNFALHRHAWLPYKNILLGP